MLARCLLNELKKELLIAWSYRLQWLGEFVALFIYFVFLNKLVNSSSFSVLSYCLWFYSFLVVGDMSAKISMEVAFGTLEQFYLSTVPLTLLLVIKLCVSILRSVVMMTLLIACFWVISGSVFVENCLDGSFLLALLVTTPGLLGLSLLLGGATIVLKNIGCIINIANNSILFLSGGLIPLNNLPSWLQCVAFFNPLRYSVSILNNEKICVAHLICINFLLLGVGFCFFICLEAFSKKRSLLGRH